MPTDRFAKKHWKMVVILLVACAAMLILRWVAMIWGQMTLTHCSGFVYLSTSRISLKIARYGQVKE